MDPIKSFLEDEVYFLLNCSKYSLIRNKFYNEVKLIPNITQLPVNVLINELINTSNYHINLQFMNMFQLASTFATNY